MTASGRYHAFLLRLWREQGADDLAWRLSLQDVPRGEQYGFCTLDELCAYLRYRVTEPGGKETLSEHTAAHGENRKEQHQ